MSLIVEIERYVRHSGLPESKFGRLAVNDPRLVGDLRRGRRAGTAVTERVLAFIRDQSA